MLHYVLKSQDVKKGQGTFDLSAISNPALACISTRVSIMQRRKKIVHANSVLFAFIRGI